MKKKKKIDKMPDLKEFTDELGKKWIQTSTDDLFSMKEINEILESIDKDKDKDKDKVVLARIDFQKVDREYYNAAKALHQKLKEQTELLKKIAEESKKTIEKKNRKLKSLQWNPPARMTKKPVQATDHGLILKQGFTNHWWMKLILVNRIRMIQMLH